MLDPLSLFIGAVCGLLAGLVMMFVRDFFRDVGEHETARSVEEPRAQEPARRVLAAGTYQKRPVAPPPDFTLPSATPGARIT